jgi:hypothetical protein
MIHDVRDVQAAEPALTLPLALLQVKAYSRFPVEAQGLTAAHAE